MSPVVVYMKKNKAKSKDIVAYVMKVQPSSIDSLRNYGEKIGVPLQIMLIWDTSLAPTPSPDQKYDILVTVDFSRPEKISQALAPYVERMLAISCRAETHIARFAKIIPNVPYLRTPTSESLVWATDKYEMRKRFKVYDPKITPTFTKVKNETTEEINRVIAKIGFPMIIKPTNLSASLLVTICYHKEELVTALEKSFKKIQKIYEGDHRIETPKIIAEQYMEGDMYSIDSYVNSRGVVYHCPLVRIKTGKEVGQSDFHGYLQMTPTKLASDTIEKAQHVAEAAIHALGLRSTTAHIELMKLDTEWKVIEVGPRVGGARDNLYRLSCDIDHSLNDVLIRIPRRPIIPKKCKGFSAYMKWFAAKEGIIVQMKGVKKIASLASFHQMNVHMKTGDRALFPRNGGRRVFDLYLYNADRSELLADIRRVEEMVHIKIA